MTFQRWNPLCIVGTVLEAMQRTHQVGVIWCDVLDSHLLHMQSDVACPPAPVHLQWQLMSTTSCHADQALGPVGTEIKIYFWNAGQTSQARISGTYIARYIKLSITFSFSIYQDASLHSVEADKNRRLAPAPQQLLCCQHGVRTYNAQHLVHTSRTRSAECRMVGANKSLACR